MVMRSGCLRRSFSASWISQSIPPDAWSTPAHVTAAISFAVIVSFLAAHISGVCPPAGWAIRAALPVLSDFWMSERLAGGGAIPVAETLRLLSAAALLVALWLGVGSALLSRRELS